MWILPAKTSEICSRLSRKIAKKGSQKCSYLLWPDYVRHESDRSNFIKSAYLLQIAFTPCMYCIYMHTSFVTGGEIWKQILIVRWNALRGNFFVRRCSIVVRSCCMWNDREKKVFRNSIAGCDSVYYMMRGS